MDCVVRVKIDSLVGGTIGCAVSTFMIQANVVKCNVSPISNQPNISKLPIVLVVDFLSASVE